MAKTAQKQLSKKTTKQGSKVISKKTSAKKASAKVSAKNTKQLSKRLSQTLSREISLRLERKETNENVSRHKRFGLTLIQKFQPIKKQSTFTNIDKLDIDPAKFVKQFKGIEYFYRNYLIDNKTLGEGAFGKVVKCQKKSNGKVFVVK